MRLSSFVGACVLCVATVSSAQSTLATRPEVNLLLTRATLAEAVDAVARAGGITIRFDESVPAEVRNRQLSRLPLKFANAPLASALEFLTSRSDLAFVVVDSTTVLIRLKSQ